MIHKVLALSYLSFFLMLSIYEILSMMVLSKRAIKLLKFIGRTGVVVVRMFLFFVSMALANLIIQNLRQSFNMEDKLFDLSRVAANVASIYIIVVHSVFSARNLGAYSFLVISQKDVKFSDPLPLSPDLINIKKATLKNLDPKKFKKIELPKLPDMKKSELAGLGLGNASPMEIQGISQLNKKELIKRVKDEKSKRNT